MSADVISLFGSSPKRRTPMVKVGTGHASRFRLKRERRAPVAAAGGINHLSQ